MTWTCDQIEAQLSDYLEGLLQAPERAAFEAHVASVRRVCSSVASVKNVMTELHSMESIEAPSRLVYVRSWIKPLVHAKKFLRGRPCETLSCGLATPKFAYGVASVMATFVIRL